MPMMWGYGFSWGGMLLMLVSWLVWAALIGLLVWALIRWLTVGTLRTGGPGSTAGPSAIETLRQRYARGEIDGPTFDQMRERLADTSARHGPATPVG
jgi:putative membrane protein